MTAALASVNFYVGQLELQAQLRESQVQRKIGKVQEACKRKLQEVHNGYTQVRASAGISLPAEQYCALNTRPYSLLNGIHRITASDAEQYGMMRQ